MSAAGVDRRRFGLTSRTKSTQGGDVPGTHEDAVLMVELAKWASMSGLAEAGRAILADDFDPDTADARDQHVQAILQFNETVGTLVRNGLLDRDLVYDWLWVAGSWDRVGPAALRMRERLGVPQLYENFEALAAGQQARWSAID
jgi:hypothetical protein